MNTDLVQWQIWDEDSDACFPWFTHPFLNWLKQQDFTGKRVLEFGGGKSSRWWRKRAKWVTTVEANKEWAYKIATECAGINNGVILLLEINEGDQENAPLYTDAGDEYGPYDIVIVDGIMRHECLLKALSLPRPLIIIHDNWQQDGFVCPASDEIMKPYEIHNFIQEDHTDNHGRKWATAYWDLEFAWSQKFVTQPGLEELGRK